MVNYMLNYVTINRCFDKIKMNLIQNEEEINLNFENIITNFVLFLEKVIWDIYFFLNWDWNSLLINQLEKRPVI